MRPLLARLCLALVPAMIALPLQAADAPAAPAADAPLPEAPAADVPTLRIALPAPLLRPLTEGLILPYQRGWAERYRNRSGTPTAPVADAPKRLVEAMSYETGWSAEADVAYVPAAELAGACADGRLQKLDWQRVGNGGDYLDAAFTPCGAGAASWAMVLAYNAARPFPGSAVPANWADFFDAARFPGLRALPDHARDTLEIALLADGVATEDVYDLLLTPAGVARAYRRLERSRESLVWWKTAADAGCLLAEEKAVLVAAPSMELLLGSRCSGAGSALVWPAGFYQVDAWAIPAKAAHPDLALNWISFAVQPENQVLLPAQIRSGVTHLATIEQVQPGLARDTPTARDTLPRLLPTDQDFWQEHGAALEAGFRAWREKQAK